MVPARGLHGAPLAKQMYVLSTHVLLVELVLLKLLMISQVDLAICVSVGPQRQMLPSF